MASRSIPWSKFVNLCWTTTFFRSLMNDMWISSRLLDLPDFLYNIRHMESNYSHGHAQAHIQPFTMLMEAARTCDENNKCFSLAIAGYCKDYYYIISWLMIVLITRCGIRSSLFTLSCFFGLLLLSAATFFAPHFFLYNKTWLFLFVYYFFFLLTNLKNHNDISALFSIVLYVQCYLKVPVLSDHLYNFIMLISFGMYLRTVYDILLYYILLY